MWVDVLLRLMKVLLHEDQKKIHSFLMEELEKGFEAVEREQREPLQKVISITDAKKKRMLDALNKNAFNFSQVIASIGISLATFYRKMQWYDIGKRKDENVCINYIEGPSCSVTAHL